MSPASRHLPALRRQVLAHLERHGTDRLLAFTLPQPWEGPDRLKLPGERSATIAWCPSELALREQLAAADGAALRILLTDRAEHELAADVLARLPKRRLPRVEPWVALLQLFQAQSVDPRVARERWMADALLNAPRAPRPAATGFLDPETAWRAVFELRLGLPDGRADLESLLAWTQGADRLRVFLEEPEEMRRAVGERWRETAGEPGRAVAHAVEEGRGGDAAPLGLALQVLYAEGAEGVQLLRDARVRLEAWVGKAGLSAAAAGAWARASAALLDRLEERDREGAAALLARGDELLAELGAAAEAARSDRLPAGARARRAHFAELLRAAVERGAAPGADLLAAEHAVCDHRRLDDAQRESAAMAVRLVRWLAAADDEAEGSGLPARARSYAVSGAFVDWARTVLGRADLGTARSAYETLLARVAERREAESRRFAQELAAWTADGGGDDRVVPVEELLARVVAPVASEAPVLLLVLDGLSLAVLEELAADLLRRGWMEHLPPEADDRRLGVATLPTVTEHSRASLFAGALTRGQQGREVRRFGSQSEIAALTGAGGAPQKLFHLGDLRGEGGAELSQGVREVVAGTGHRVVAAVVNAVDTHLTRGEQVVPSWTVGAIRPLGGLLDAAAEGGRVVVLTSDHGHVLDRGTHSRTGGGGGERWRAAGGPLEDGEIELLGPRVVAGDGRIVALWSERFRYGAAKRAGYHGGVSPQEVLTPILVLATRDEPLAGWRLRPRRLPAWWQAPVAAASGDAGAGARAERAAGPRSRAGRPAAPEEPQLGLFEEPAAKPAPRPEPTRPGSAGAPWIGALLASDLMASQREIAGPTALPEEEVRRWLELLALHGGRMTLDGLSATLGLPDFRVSERAAALERLLNLEGYAVLERAEQTIRLDRALLAAQFGLEE